jgi:hypothetical protein
VPRETEEHVIPANFYPELEWLFFRDEATSAKDDLVLVSGKIGAAERTATVSIRQSVARYLNRRAAARKRGRTVPNEEPWGTAVPANPYWTKGQSDITADDAGMAMLKAISAAA